MLCVCDVCTFLRVSAVHALGTAKGQSAVHLQLRSLTPQNNARGTRKGWVLVNALN